MIEQFPVLTTYHSNFYVVGTNHDGGSYVDGPMEHREAGRLMITLLTEDLLSWFDAEGRDWHRWAYPERWDIIPEKHGEPDFEKIGELSSIVSPVYDAREHGDPYRGLGRGSTIYTAVHLDSIGKTAYAHDPTNNTFQWRMSDRLRFLTLDYPIVAITGEIRRRAPNRHLQLAKVRELTLS